MDYLEFKNYILENYAGKRIDEKVIRKFISADEYDEYCKWLDSLIDEKLIKPIKSSGPNGLRPILYKRYQVLKIVGDTHNYTLEVKKLNSVFNIEGYLNKPQRYIVEREVVLKIDEFIRMKKNLIEDPASINERSFQIFGEEKFIKLDSVCKSVLNFNNRLEEYLNMYYTPEPFFEQTVTDDTVSNVINVLLIENKDTWYTLKKLMKRNYSLLYGIRFDSLIYGEGKKITRKRNSLTDFSQTYYDKVMPIRYYYFGDLDMEGIEIFEKVVRVNPDLNIELFNELYIDMLKMAEGRIMPMSKELQQPSIGKEFFNRFTKLQVTEIKQLLASGKYIPQEILNYGYFKRKVEMSN